MRSLILVLPGFLFLSALFLSALLSGCVVGPKYKTPSTATAPAFKELTPADFPNTDGWKQAQPQDSTLHGNWWEIFGDPTLNDLEAKVDGSNQTIAAASANFFAARSLVKASRAQFFPTATAAPSILFGREPLQSSKTLSEYLLPFDASWVPDLFGRVRNTVNANFYSSQALAADLENTRLTIHAEVAADYFQLRGQDSLKLLLDSTVVAYQQSLNLTTVLYQTGIDSDEAVAQAETQLESTQALATNLGILRAQEEHAIAILTGQPPSALSIAVQPLSSRPPAIPFGVPSELLERRPDIAASERLVAQANAQIGVAQAAYYPTVTLSAQAGFESLNPATWFNWSQRLWAVGPALSELLYDGGLRRATMQQFTSQYNATVANYRETVLTAFQQVEDNLSTLRILSGQIQQQDTAVTSAQRYLQIANDRYQLGLDPFLFVITAQTTLLSNQVTAQDLRIEQMVSSVQLIEALGGGWSAAQLPNYNNVIANPAANSPAVTMQQ